MKIYIDIIILINFIFDTVMLTATDLILKLNKPIKRFIIPSIIGEISIITLFINLNNIELFIFKIILLLLMVYISFGYKNLLYNSFCTYFIGIIMGGIFNYLYNEFSINHEYSITYLFIIFITPLLLGLYIFLFKSIKQNNNYIYSITILYNNTYLKGNLYLDSGNSLTSYTGTPVILIEKKYIVNKNLKLIPIPFNSLNKEGIIYCFKPDNVYINNKEVKALIGISDISFNKENVIGLLNSKLERYL